MRLLKSGGVYVNNARVADEKARLTAADAIGGEVFVLRKGRKDQHIVRSGVMARASVASEARERSGASRE